MQRITLPERLGWKAKAEDLGFRFHTMYGEPYWDESSAYAFTLDQIETDIEDPSSALHAMCLDAVDVVAASEELMNRLGIPSDFHDFVAGSWTRRDLALYGRLDLAYDGAGPAKLLEYNADTPTSLYEAASFQWIWLEDMRASGALPADVDQFNGIHEAMVARFRTMLAPGSDLHFTSAKGLDEDFATVEYMAWTAKEAGLVAHYVALEDIGLTTTGQFADAEDRVIGAIFKLYPWEDMLADPFSAHIPTAQCRMIEPAWKSLVSNKGILPVLWQMFEGHPNLLPAFFEEDFTRSDRDVEARIARAAETLGRGRVVKPIFSREGASVDILSGDLTLGQGGRIIAEDRSYDAHPKIVQAYAPLPEMGGMFPVLGAWIVGDVCVGLGVREDASRITQNLSRFKPHFVRN
jgi:glutathionylspermidine synthase